MISVAMKGRMGNNMFQLAAALSLAARHNTFTTYDGDSHLSCFELSDALRVSRDVGNTPNVYNEYKFNFNEEFANLPDGTHLDGYFQSYKYHDCERVRRNFLFDIKVLDSVMSSAYGKYFDIDYAFLHVRRGDYVGIQHAHPIPPIAYYEEALKKVECPVLVFSDDLAWCRNNFIGERFVFVDLPAAECMLMMTHAGTCIISNSTFAWWGAYLNDRADDIFAPKKWFGPTLPYRAKDVDLATCTRDLFPPTWKLI